MDMTLYDYLLSIQEYAPVEFDEFFVENFWDLMA